MSDEEPIVYVSRVTQTNDLQEFLQDDQLDRAMELAIECLHNPNVPAVKVRALIVELQTISFFMSAQAATYATIKRDRAGTENNFKKNIYYSMREAIDNLVSALKYSAKDT